MINLTATKVRNSVFKRLTKKWDKTFTEDASNTYNTELLIPRVFKKSYGSKRKRPTKNFMEKWAKGLGRDFRGGNQNGQ